MSWSIKIDQIMHSPCAEIMRKGAQEALNKSDSQCLYTVIHCLFAYFTTLSNKELLVIYCYWKKKCVATNKGRMWYKFYLAQNSVTIFNFETKLRIGTGEAFPNLENIGVVMYFLLFVISLDLGKINSIWKLLCVPQK